MINFFLLGFMFSGFEWIIILLVIFLFFGGKKIFELMCGFGKGVKSFKEGVNEVKEEINKVKEEIDELENKEKKDNWYFVLFLFFIWNENRMKVNFNCFFFNNGRN